LGKKEMDRMYYATLLRDFGNFKKGQNVKVIYKMHFGELRIKSLDGIHSGIINEENLKYATQ
jgi:hypothetical protein